MNQSDTSNTAMTAAGLNLIAQALSIYDNNLRLAVCNRRFQEMFDLPDELATPGGSFEDTLRFIAQSGDYGAIEDIDAFVQTRIDQALNFVPHYFERTRPNGQVISVEGFPLPQGGWVTVYTDISRTKRIEQLLRTRSEELSDKLIAHTEELSATNRKLASSVNALEETQRQLTDMERRTRLTTEMMPAHIAHVNAEGVYTYTNKRISEVFPNRDTDIVGRHTRDILGDVSYDRIEPYLLAAYKGASPVFEFTEERSRRRVRVAFTPDQQGGVYILSMDVTEETQARVALQQVSKRETAAQMTNGLAHDFSNLLTIIMGLQSKLQKMTLEPEAEALVQATQSAARRGGRLLHRIAEMTSTRPLRPQATRMQTLLDELRILASASLPRGVGLSILNHAAEPPLLLDAGKLQDALVNLVLNARDACGSSGQITVTAHDIGETWLELQVSDTGPGFSAAALEHALNPFFTTKGSEGSGLGLSMVYDMVKLAGGEMRLGNTPSGASVTLRLPYRLAPAPGGGMALLVEDEDHLRETFRDMLIDLGYNVIEAVSVEEASALLADLPDISLVLSDVKLAGEASGLDLLDRLPEVSPPVILMTSMPTTDPLFRLALKRAPVLRKPFTTHQLSQLINPERRS